MIKVIACGAKFKAYKNFIPAAYYTVAEVEKILAAMKDSEAGFKQRTKSAIASLKKAKND